MATAHVNGSYGNGREALALPPVIPPRRVTATPSRTRLLGEFLLREGLVTEAQLGAALRAQEERPDGTPIGQFLVEQGALSRRRIWKPSSGATTRSTGWATSSSRPT